MWGSGKGGRPIYLGCARLAWLQQEGRSRAGHTLRERFHLATMGKEIPQGEIVDDVRIIPTLCVLLQPAGMEVTR